MQNIQIYYNTYNSIKISHMILFILKYKIIHQKSKRSVYLSIFLMLL